MSIQDDTKRYLAAAHAMQSGVAMMMEVDDTNTTPKHLRVGVNSAMVETSALVRLLIDKGILTDEEWMTRLANAMEAERDIYLQEVRKAFGPHINLA